MNILIWILIIIILIVLFLIYLLIQKRIEYSVYEKFSHNYEDIKKSFKTGDIILFSYGRYKTLLEEIGYVARTKLFNTLYGHVGIVLRNNDDLFLIECVSEVHTAKKLSSYLNDYNKGGVRIIKLDTIIREYHNIDKGVFAVKFIENEISNDLIINNLNNYKDIIFEDFQKIIPLAFVDFVSHKLSNKVIKKYKNNKRMTCGEFLYKLLLDCKLVNNYQCKLFWPYLFTNGKFDKLSKIKYSDPVRFVYKHC